MTEQSKTIKIVKLKINTTPTVVSILKEWQDSAWKVANMTIQGIEGVRIMYRTVALNDPSTGAEYEEISRALAVEIDRSKRKSLLNRRNELENKASQNVGAFIGKGGSEPNLVYRNITKSNVSDGLPSSIYNSIKDKVYKNWKQKRIEIEKGEMSIPSYTAGSPVDFGKKSIRNWRDLGDGTIAFKFIPTQTQDTDFFIEFGKDRSNKRAIVENIINGTYHLCDSSYTVDEGDVYFNFCFQLPKEPLMTSKNLVMGLDFGMKCPMAYAIVEVKDGSCSPLKIRGTLGRTSKILEKEKAVKKKRKLAQAERLFKPGGKGRTHKNKQYETALNTIQNYRKNVIHNLTREVVKICVREKVKTIKIENLKGFSKSKQYKSLGNSFPYFMMKTVLSYKAAHHGIDVIEVSAAYTSKTCHVCDEINEELKNENRWKCKSCGTTHHRDINAAYNIAKREIGFSGKKSPKKTEAMA